jgi:hypothetical protein
MILDYIKKIYSGHSDRDLLHEILSNQHFIISKLLKMDQSVIDLQAAVAAEQTVETGVITLLQQLTGQLQSGIDAGDLAAIQATTDQIKANTTALAAAVTANTPAAPAPVATGGATS